jgi:hypothetical protein
MLATQPLHAIFNQFAAVSVQAELLQKETSLQNAASSRSEKSKIAVI